jgi:NADPH2 dehydrogenase
MENRFSPLSLPGPRLLRNRVVVPPMASQTATPAGFVTEAMIEHYRRLACSGAALVWVEYSYVGPSGKSEANQLGIWHDGQIEGLARLARAIRESGALAGIQITHAGGKTERALTGGALQSPSGIAVPVKGRELETPDVMDAKTIARWKRDFHDAILRARAAGFDAAEFHAAHGYGLNQWLSPITNRREDRYGGSLAHRARILLEIARDAREAFPREELLLSARIPGQDHLPGGITPEESEQLARLLEEAGLDLIDVSSGLGGWRRPEGSEGEGYLLEDASRIARATRLPVIGVGGIKSGPFIDRAIDERRISLAAVGRAILQDPQGWRQAHLSMLKSAQDAHRPGQPQPLPGI